MGGKAAISPRREDKDGGFAEIIDQARAVKKLPDLHLAETQRVMSGNALEREVRSQMTLVGAARSPGEAGPMTSTSVAVAAARRTRDHPPTGSCPCRTAPRGPRCHSRSQTAPRSGRCRLRTNPARRVQEPRGWHPPDDHRRKPAKPSRIPPSRCSLEESAASRGEGSAVQTTVAQFRERSA